MKGFEARKEDQHPAQAESWVELKKPEVQIGLALFAYRAAHHQPSIDIAHWDKNKEEIQSAAMMEWYGDLTNPNPNSYAARYRRYVEAHPGKAIDTANNLQLEEFLTTLSSAEWTLQ
jgi:hypothetical protein